MAKYFVTLEKLQLFKDKIVALIPTKLSQLNNDGNFVQDASYVHTDANFTTAEKTKLGNIEAGANKTVIYDGLDSTNAEQALSAAQGKALNDKIDGINTEIENLGVGDMLKSVYDADDDGKVDVAANAEKLGGNVPSYYAPATAIPTNVSQLNNDAGYLTTHQDISGKLDKTGDASDTTAKFTAAAERANIVTGEKVSVIFGKIAKFFADLKTVAFTGSYNDLTDKPTIPTDNASLANGAGYQTAAQVEATVTSKGYQTSEQVEDAITAKGYQTSAQVESAITAKGYQTEAQVDTKINAKIASVYKPGGTVAFASLPAASADNLGMVYNVSDAFTTDARFVEGAGYNYVAGTNVVIVENGGSYKYDVLAGFVDLTNYWSEDELVEVSEDQINAMFA